MAKTLTVSFVKSVSRPGAYGDLHGLRLIVQKGGSKSWVWRGTIQGVRRDLGIGSMPYVTLHEARETAFEYRRLARAGGDPRIGKHKEHAAAVMQLATVQAAPAMPTFADGLEAVLKIQRAGWKNPKTEADWRQSLRDHAASMMGKPLDAVSTADVLAALEPIWHCKPQTAKRVKQRIVAVLDWAIAQGCRTDNPAQAVAAVLPKANCRPTHHKALPHGEVKTALSAVAERKLAHWATKAAFAFLVHTAARSIEAREAKWTEIDLDAGVWTIPASRMKMKVEHRVPLTPQALAILHEARELSDSSGLVFPSARGKPITNAAVSKLLHAIGIAAVPHGFRSSFRDWASDTGQPRELAEAALAHAVGNAVERAYARSDLLERRRGLMATWSAYIDA